MGDESVPEGGPPPRLAVEPAGIFLARPEAAADEGPQERRLAVKDLLDTAGLTTTYGSAIFADHVPVETAAAVLLAEQGGYVNVGKTNLHEFAYGITSQNPHFGTVPNPLRAGRLAGGSSGGSAAALAAGLADAALGTDSGGSIRIPAACCGVVGFKPSYGRVPLEGCFPVAPSFDHVGPMACSVAACSDLAADLDPGLETLPPAELEELTLGVAWLDDCSPGVRARVEEVAALFPKRRRLDFPVERSGAVFMREVADVHRELFVEYGHAYGENVRTKIELCLAVTDEGYDEGVRARERYREAAAEALADCDLLLTPTLPFVAPEERCDELELRREMLRFTYPFNLLGWPALALPCGLAEEGLPASAQLVGPAGGDALVLAAGVAVERRLPPDTSV